MPAKVKKVDWRCPQCGKRLWLRPCDATIKQYCSHACHYKGMQRHEKPKKPKKTFGQRACVWCQQMYEARTAHQKACSRACALQIIHHQRIDVSIAARPCEACGMSFRPRPGNVGRFCSRACTYAGQKGHLASHWNGGRHVTPDGYVKVRVPTHPAAHGHGGYVAEHRVVMEAVIGRYLLPQETVHHKNGNRADNRIENLELWASRHGKGQRVEELVAWAHEVIALYTPLLPLFSGG